MQSRSNHYRIYHTLNLDKMSTECQPSTTQMSTECQPTNIKNNYKCENCTMIFTTRQAKSRHLQKSCKIKNTNTIISELKSENIKMKKQNEELNNKFNELLKLCKIHPKTLQKINNQLINNNINNGIINNTINIVKFGSEDLSTILSQSEILKILNRKMSSLEESIKIIHCNENRPEFKNIYITNLKDKYAYIFDGNKFTAGLKTDILDELVDNHVENIEISMDEYKNKLQPKTIEVLDKFIEKMNNDDEFTDKEHKIKYPNYKQFKINLIKLMIYNESDKRTNIVNLICDKVDLPTY